MTDSDILILGAGLAGLSCAHHLRDGASVFEKAHVVGGTATTNERHGFHFDVTGHWLHLRDAEIERLVRGLLGDELIEIQRIAQIHSHNMRTPYPFQANTHGLPADVIADCVLGYFRAREAVAAKTVAAPQNFEQYIRQCMGDGIAEHFMVPYNTKIWTMPPSEMSHTWCERFVPIPSPEEIVRGAITPAGAGHQLGYNSSFLYPREGGIARLPEALHRALQKPAQLGVEARKIHWQQRQVAFSDGQQLPYKALVSTMPLDVLVTCLVDAPEAIRSAREVLRAASVTYWDVGISGPNQPGDAHWVYFPESEVPFYRAGSASAALPGVAPADHRSHYIEVSHPQGTPCPSSEQDILDGMRRVGLLQANEEPVVMHQTTIDCAYVLMDDAYGAARDTILEWLESQGILSVGRYGAWTYDSMEGAMVQGRQAAAAALEMIR